ncbi:MAG: O-antigen ligase family protein [Rhodanobacteraceae bacterium]
MMKSLRGSEALSWPLLPIVLVPLLLPVGRASELGTLLGMLGGLWIAWRHWPALARLRSLRLFALLFACYAGAALISLPDAVNPGKSWGTFAAIWRYAPFGAYVCWVLYQRRQIKLLYLLVAALVALWALDAWLQILTGWSLGGPAGPLRVSGVFGADNLKLGPILATLSPFALWPLRQRWAWRGVAAGFILLLVPVVMAGSRQAWLEFALVGLAFAWQLGATPAKRAGWLGAGAAVALAVMALAWYQSPGFAQRMQRSAHIFQGQETSADWALSGRLAIWATAVRMIEAHPVNGVGVRDFRYAYPDFARPGDQFTGGEACAPGQGACHPHQWLLEVATGSGLAGLILWFAGIGMALRAWWRAEPEARQRAWPVSLALGVCLFPVNTHLAFYSAWWGLVFWWLLALWCAVVAADSPATEVHRGRT